MMPGNKFVVNDDGDKVVLVVVGTDGKNPNAVGRSEARIGIGFLVIIIGVAGDTLLRRRMYY